MICKNCGKENDDGMRFCENCGTELKDTNETAVKKKSNKAVLPVIAVIAAAVIAFGVFYTVGSSMSNPEKVAKEYITAQVEKDYEKLYSLMDIPEGEFTGKKQFTDTMELTYAEKSDDKMDYIELAEATARDMGAAPDFFSKAYIASYATKNGVYDNAKVFLKRMNGKTMLLFDKYAVIATDCIAEKYEIDIPEYFDLKFDDIALDDKYYDDKEKGYVLNNIFTGTHKITVSAPFIDETEIPAKVTERGSISLLSQGLEIKPELKDEMQKTTEYIIKLFFDSSQENKDFSEISPQLNIAQGQENEIETMYKNICNRSWSGFSRESVIDNQIEFGEISTKSQIYLITEDSEVPIAYETYYSVKYDVRPTGTAFLLGDTKGTVSKMADVRFAYTEDGLKVYSVIM